MRLLKIPTNPQELLGKLLTVVKYFVLSKGIVSKIQMHKAVLKTLSPFRQAHLIFFRATVMYILPYLSKCFGVHQKRDILIGHYTFLSDNFSSYQLRRLFGDGFEIYSESNTDDRYSIILKSVTNHLEFEGSMSLLFNQNDITLYSLSFTFIEGKIFDMDDPFIIYISALQGVKNTFDKIRVSTKYFKDNSLPLILLKTLEVTAFSLGIKKCVGISAANHLSLKEPAQFQQFFNTYDLFWLNNGATSLNGDYSLKLPLEQKPILEIAQTHRNRTLKKRQKISEVTANVSKTLSIILHKRMSFHHNDEEPVTMNS